MAIPTRMKDENVLKQCEDHGYFRGKRCPLCGSDGKYLMKGDEIDHVGRLMAGILRHFPERFDVKVDEHGWAEVKDLVNAIRSKRITLQWLRTHHIKGIVETDPKGRYEMRGTKIRATYGHTIDVKLDHPREPVPEKLYYPTTSQEVEILFETGLRPTDRKHVHLSLTYDFAVEAGLHRDVNPVIIEVDAAKAIEDGIVIMKAAKTVFITDHIPAKYMSIVERKEGEA